MMNPTPDIPEEEFGPIGQAVMRLGVLAYGLTEDRVWASEMLESDNEAGSARRVYIRTAFTFIEGMTHAFKDLLLAANECGKVNLSEGEEQILREIQYRIDSKYNAKAVRNPIRMKRNVRFTITLLGRSARQPFSPDFGGQGWEAFVNAIKIRNRITHPKSRDDHWVAEDDLDVIDEALEWLEEETGRFMKNFDLDLFAQAA